MTKNIFDSIAVSITRWTGSKTAFSLATSSIILWLITGSYFNYSDTWQLVINTTTTIVTFLMVFLIQYAQNKEYLAIHIKLNELIVNSAAKNELLTVESLTDEEVKILYNKYAQLKNLHTGGEPDGYNSTDSLT